MMRGRFWIWSACAALGISIPGAALAQTPTWTFTPTAASGSLLGTVTVNGAPAAAGTWIGAFDPDGHCAGAAALILNAGTSYVSLAIYGDDPTTPSTDEGITGTEPFTLRLAPAGTALELPYPSAAAPLPLNGWANTNGAPMPAFADPNTLYAFTFEATATLACPPPALCPAADPWPLQPFPPGGVLSGPGIGPDGLFDPAAAGPGLHLLSYTFAGTTADCTVEVTPTPTATVLTAGPFCANDAPAALEAVPPGGSWWGTGVFPLPDGTIAFDPSAAGPGTYPVTYTLDLPGCSASTTAALAVLPAPDAPTVADAGGALLATAGGSGSANSGLTFTWLTLAPDGTPLPTGLTGPLLADPVPGTTYLAAATNPYGCTATSAPFPVAPTSVATLHPDGTLSSAVPPEDLRIFDASGRELDPGPLPGPGCYLLVARVGTAVVRQRVVFFE
jgi:hypothetical protein